MRIYPLGSAVRLASFLSALVVLSLLATANEAWATHFRYGHLSWKARPDIATNAAEFTLFGAFRRDGYAGSAADGRPAIGDIITEFIGGTTLTFGDGQALGTLNFLVVAIDPAGNWLYAKALADLDNVGLPIIHVYATAGPYTAEINSCCRISNSINAPDGSYRVFTLVDFASESASPVSTVPAIVNCSSGAPCTFAVPAADADGDSLRFRPATTTESGLSSQPAGLTVDVLTGQVSWNTTGRTLGLYSAQVIIEAKDPTTGFLKSQVAVDFLISLRLAPVTGNPPIFTQAAPSCGTTFDWVGDKTLTFTIQSRDNDAGDTVALNAIGLPAGATMTPSLPAIGNPISSMFSWKPSTAQEGPHVVVFTATDTTARQAQCSIIVDVKIDNDGDGLPDSWDTFGYTYKGHFVDLPAMGADPNQKDIFVHVDYMATGGLFGHSHRPDPRAIRLIVDAFARVPNTLLSPPNPNGNNGVRLHVTVDSALAEVGVLGTFPDPSTYDWADFDVLKLVNFPEELSLSHHYAIFAHEIPGGYSGIARDIPSSDFIVSLGGGFLFGVGTVWEQAGTFMHELGHNLGLGHGGNSGINYKPNYLSVMNYSFQFNGLRRGGANGWFDYSRFILPTLNETNLNESSGLGAAANLYGTTWYCGGDQRWTENATAAIDWDCSGNFTSAAVGNINNDAGFSNLNSYNDWRNLNFKGGLIGAGIVVPLPRLTAVEELDFDSAREIKPFPPAGLAARVAIGSVRLNWVPLGPTTEWKYRVYRSTSTSAAALLGETSASAVIDNSVAPGQGYTYYVTAVDARGAESGPSNVVAVVAR